MGPQSEPRIPRPWRSEGTAQVGFGASLARNRRLGKRERTGPGDSQVHLVTGQTEKAVGGEQWGKGTRRDGLRQIEWAPL